MSFRIGRRRRDGRTVPCLLAGDGIVRDASAWVEDWCGTALDPDFLADLEAGLEERPDAVPPLGDPPGVPDVPFRGGRTLACVGQNFTAHAAEAAIAPPVEPTVYLKPYYTLAPSGSRVTIPPGCATVTWEGELAVVLGRPAHRLAGLPEALEVVAGYTPANDLGDCHWVLHRGGQWVKGKGFDRFTPLGEWLLVGRDRHPASAATVVTRVNGHLTQRASLAEMTWAPTYLVWYASQFLHLVPGDVLACGTPSGTALASGAYLAPGDRVEVHVDGVGLQVVFFTAPDPGPPAFQTTDDEEGPSHEAIRRPGRVHGSVR